jgi:hypothetical protein
MSLPTIGDLVAEPTLPLRQVAGAADGRHELRSAHVTDLSHPARYLLPGELVLTNGLWLEHVAPADWIAEVAEAGASAVGFGLGTPYVALPDGLLQACEAHDLPLLEVPDGVPFRRIQDVLAARLESDVRAVMRRHLDRTRDLLQRLADGAGHAGLVSLLRQATGHGCALVGPGARVLAAADLEPTPEQARAAVRTARAGRLPAGIEGGLTAFGPQGEQHPGSTLLVASPLNALSDEARVVVGQVVVHAALEEARARTGREFRGGVARELLGLVASGDLSEGGLAVRLEALGLDPAAPLAIVASANTPAAIAYAGEALGAPHVVTDRGDVGLVLLAPGDEDDPAGVLAASIDEGGETPVLGTGRAGTGTEGLRRSLREALAALALAKGRPQGDRVVRHLDVGSHVLLLDLAEPHVLDAFREAVLGPVETWDAEHGTDLVTTLRTFLEQGGRWRTTAGLMHVHHNTLRHRLARVERLTGRDMDATADRVDLHLALMVAPRA